MPLERWLAEVLLPWGLVIDQRRGGGGGGLSVSVERQEGYWREGRSGQTSGSGVFGADSKQVDKSYAVRSLTGTPHDLVE